MAYKGNDPCINAAAEDEPIFVLRANDELAPDVVRYWVHLSMEQELHADKLDEARHWADVMAEWKAAQVGTIVL
jgi:hypothetical protein